MASKANRPEKRGQGDGNTQKSGAASAIELLEADHREVEALFEQYEELEDRPKKELLALKICLSLQVHAQIEEEIFYPAARKAIAKAELIDEAIVEHAAAREGDRLELFVDTTRLHFFDPDTGLGIYDSAG